MRFLFGSFIVLVFAKLRSMVYCWVLLFVVLFLVVCFAFCLCLGYSCLDVLVDKKVIRPGYMCLVSSDILSGMLWMRR